MSMNPNAVEFFELVQQIYAKYPTGGALHIVLDDGNVRDSDLQWCLYDAIPDEPEEDQPMLQRCILLLESVHDPDDRALWVKEAWRRVHRLYGGFVSVDTCKLEPFDGQGVVEKVERWFKG